MKVHREQARWLAALVLGSLLLLSACTRGPAAPPAGDGGGETPTAPPADTGAPPGPAPEPAPAAYTVIMWGEMGDAGQEFQLVPVERALTEQPDGPEALARAAVQALLDGPTAEEKARGLFSNVPEGIKLNGVTLARPVAVVDLSAGFAAMGGTMRVSGALDQLAATVARVPGVKGVELRIDGQRTGTGENPFTGDGFLFHHLLPPVATVLPDLEPEGVMDLFIAAAGNARVMWEVAGPDLRQQWGSMDRIDTAGYAEGLGSYRDYQVATRVDGDRATVTLTGKQVLEGMEETVTYVAQMVRTDGAWRFNGGARQ